MNEQARLFPKDFSFGVATAAYQIEGAALAEGKGLSVWDEFCRKPGVIFDGHTGEVACDHYFRYQEDVALLARLGVDSYRFSISWPRIFPNGIGTPNRKGLDFYSRLVDALVERGIKPMCTLFHWDLPQTLYERGGWLNREVAAWFAEYAASVAGVLGDRITTWTTLNEPQCFIGMGLLDGVHAPGDRLSVRSYLKAAHNAMLGHGRAVQSLRAYAPHSDRTKIGYVLATRAAQPETPKDINAARWATFSIRHKNQWNNTWWTDPVLLGKYPDDGLALYEADVPEFEPDDLQVISQPIDFIGLNIYSATTWRVGTEERPEYVAPPPGYPRSGVDWQLITPEALYWAPKFFFERYRLPISITENGLSTRDQIFLDGHVHDPQRIDYLHRVLLELARAIDDGVQVDSYYVWSLLDNFEWADGYKQRFGLVYVDYQTMRRIPKDSFHWYRDVIATRGRDLRAPGLLPAGQVTDRSLAEGL